MIDFSLGLKRLLPRGMFGRSVLIILMPLLLLQLVSGYIFYSTHWETVTRRQCLVLAGELANVVELIGQFPDAESRLSILTITAQTMDLRFAFLPGAILPNSPPPEISDNPERFLADAIEATVQRPFTLDSDSVERYFKIDIQLSSGLLEVIAPKKRIISATTFIFILWMTGTSLFLFAIATIFMRNQVRSVRKLAAAADAFGKGRDITDFKPEGPTEIRQAALAFNLMRERLKRQMDQRTEMLAGVSHDLRTPLTRMKLQLAMMEEGEGLEELNEDVADMERMIEGYLAFARGEGSEAVSAIDLVDLVESLVSRARREGHDILWSIPDEPLILPCRPHALERALMNLLSNACRYGTHVRLTTGQSSRTIEILVDDDGPGIPLEKREEVFKAFTRLEGSRNPLTGGIGLGLAIARDVVRSHGGEILLSDSPMGGLRAKVRLPL